MSRDPMEILSGIETVDGRLLALTAVLNMATEYYSEEARKNKCPPEYAYGEALMKMMSEYVQDIRAALDDVGRVAVLATGTA